MKKIILASKSVDRAELLKQTMIQFDKIITKVDEDEIKAKQLTAVELVKELAKLKALKAKQQLTEKNAEGIIIAADTVVECCGKIYGKANNEKVAFKILKELVGRSHNLLTGIAITETCNPKLIVDSDATLVKFLKLTDDEIKSYIKSGEWIGRAGAYSIRDKAGLFIESIEGSDSNVIGLPLHKVYKILKREFNLNLITLR